MDVWAAHPRASSREREKVESRLAANTSGSVDYQIRPTSSSIPVDDKRLLLFSDRRNLPSTPGRPTVFAQERYKVCPCFAFAPGILQSTSPAASGLEVCSRGGVDDRPDGVGALLLAKSE